MAFTPDMLHAAGSCSAEAALCRSIVEAGTGHSAMGRQGSAALPSTLGRQGSGAVPSTPGSSELARQGSGSVSPLGRRGSMGSRLAAGGPRAGPGCTAADAQCPDLPVQVHPLVAGLSSAEHRRRLAARVLQAAGRRRAMGVGQMDKLGH